MPHTKRPGGSPGYEEGNETWSPVRECSIRAELIEGLQREAEPALQDDDLGQGELGTQETEVHDAEQLRLGEQGLAGREQVSDLGLSALIAEFGGETLELAVTGNGKRNDVWHGGGLLCAV